MASEQEPNRQWHRSYGKQAPSSMGAKSDNIAARYSAMADDAAMSEAKKAVAMHASLADKHLQEGYDHKEVLKNAIEAVGKCYAAGDKETMADMLRLQIKAYILRASLARQEKASGAQATVSDSLKKAELIAQGELALFKQSGNIRGQASMLLSSAEILLERSQGGSQLALEAAKQARQLFAKLGDKKYEAVSLLALAAAQRAAGEKQQALVAANEALAFFKEAGDKPQEARALHAVAQARVVTDSYNAYTSGIQAAKEALALFEELGDQREQANELLTIAVMNLERDCPEQAVPPAKQAITILRQTGRDVGWQSAAVAVLIQAHQALDEDGAALNAGMDALAWAQNNGQKRSEIFLRDALAHVHLRAGNGEGAEKEIKEGLTDARDLDDKELQGRLMLTQCQAAVRKGELQDALKSVRDALKLFQDMDGAERDVAAALHMRADVLCMTGQLEEAAEAAAEAQGYYADAEDASGEGTVLLLMAALSGVGVEALETAVRAQELFKAAGESRLQALALNAAIEIHVLGKDYEKALELAGVRKSLMEEAGYKREEARTLHAMASVHLAKGDGAQALTRAREGLRMARAEGDKATEVHMCLQAVHACVVLISEASDPGSKTVRSFVDEGTKAARDAVAVAKKVLHGSLSGPAFYWQGQLLLTIASPDAQAAATSALAAFKKESDRLGTAHALLLLGQCDLSAGDRPSAEAHFQDSLAAFAEIGSSEGQAMVQAVIAQTRPMDGGYMPMAMPVMGEVAAASAAAPLKKAADPEVVRGQIRKLVLEALENDDVNQDTPLMDSGLDSLASVSFRNEMSKFFALPLPASLIFDYPSIQGLTGYICELQNEDL